MNKCFRTSIRLNTNDARSFTKILVQNLQQSSPPKRPSFLSYSVKNNNAPTKKHLAEFKASSRPTRSLSRPQEDYTIALQQAFQNFTRRTAHQGLKPTSTVAPSQDTPAIQLMVPDHQKTADKTHNNQTTAKTAADTNREAPASLDTPEQKTLSTTTVSSKELDHLHCVREREDRHQTIPSNPVIAKETSTAVDAALSRIFRNYQNQKQLANSWMPETCPFRNPMNTPVMHQSPSKSNEPQAAPPCAKFSIQTETVSSLPPKTSAVNIILQRICTQPPLKPSLSLLPSSSPLFFFLKQWHPLPWNMPSTSKALAWCYRFQHHTRLCSQSLPSYCRKQCNMLPWNKTLLTHAQLKPKMNFWQQMRQHLHANTHETHFSISHQSVTFRPHSWQQTDQFFSTLPYPMNLLSCRFHPNQEARKLMSFHVSTQ